jgi:hypothetical protein
MISIKECRTLGVNEKRLTEQAAEAGYNSDSD